MSSRKLIPAALLAALLAAPACAADLGDTRVLSHVGQPLNAEIDLTGVTAAEAGRLAVRPASADLYLQANIKPHPALSSLKFEVEQRNGQAVVRATSSKPIAAPYLHVFVEVPSGSGYAVRALTFWLTPAPAGAVVAQEDTAKAKARPKVKPQVAVAAPAAAAKAAESAAAPTSAPAASAVAHAVPASAQWGKPGPAPAVIAAAAAAKASAPALVKTAAPAEAPAANGQSVSTHAAPAGPGVTSTHAAASGPGVTSTHAAPSGPGVTSTRPITAVPAADTVSTRAAHAPAAAKEAPVRALAAAPAADHAALPAACPAPKQLRAQLQQCVATQSENQRINTQIEVLEQKVDTLRHAVAAPAPAVKPLKTKNPNAWIWSIGVPAIIAALAMAGAAWFAGRRQGRRAGDKRQGKRKAEPAEEVAEEDGEENAEEERAAVKGMLAKARAALRKMRAGKAKAADAALPEPETATQEE